MILLNPLTSLPSKFDIDVGKWLIIVFTSNYTTQVQLTTHTEDKITFAMDATLTIVNGTTQAASSSKFANKIQGKASNNSTSTHDSGSANSDSASSATSEKKVVYISKQSLAHMRMR